MLRDASHRHTIQKFSFIESLNLSRAQNFLASEDFARLNKEGTFKSQQQESQPQVSLDKVEEALPKAGALATTTDTAIAIDPNWYQPTNNYSLSLAKILYDTNSSLVPIANSHSAPKNNLGKILFAFACSYCLFVIWWVFGHQSSNLWASLMGGKNVVLSKSDVEFIDYLERSLDKVNRDLAANQKSNEEVVYVPVYTPSIGDRVADNVANNNVPLTNLPDTNIPAPPPALLPIPAPPPLPTPTPIVENPASDTAIASKPQITHALIGILELGERSAALVKVQGKTRRIWVGEEINADGWILESVGNQRANISNAGQVRSISVGETF